MKKLMFACAATAAMLAVADGIESSNIVGFNTDSITKGKFNMISVPFESTDGSGFKLNNCLTGENLVGASDPYSSDLIQIWDPATGTYDNWFFYDVGDEYTGWWDEGTGESLFEDVYPNGLPGGSAFWYKSTKSASSDGSIVVSGQIPEAADVTAELMKGKFNMVAFPYPATFKLNDADAADWTSAKGAADPYSSDLIQIWDAESGTYDNWFYYDVGDEYTGWWDEGTGESLFEDVYTDGLAVGKPFWYKAAAGSGTFDVRFFSPIK